MFSQNIKITKIYKSLQDIFLEDNTVLYILGVMFLQGTLSGE